ncbi:nuclear transport factor 2 family protein [Haliea sp. E17]|uniref:nuclear transport factor 2 family protein n=1 Tax=Haliea sp. E17 TaxID=3401576 RepID=UPI003AB00CF9
MPSIPLETRVALQDQMTEYCYLVDNIGELDPLLDYFTEDAVLDFSAIGLPFMNGRADYRKFYSEVFENMSHHTHYLTNFRIDAYDGDSASTRAYVQGMGRANDGNEVLVHVRYTMDFVREGDQWKCRKYNIYPGMPLPASLDEIHGDR